MADDGSGFQPIAQQAAAQKDDGSGFVPLPKAPDMSGAQKMAQKNIAANDNEDVPEGGETKPPTTEQRYDASGLPVSKIINGNAQSSDATADARGDYVKAKNNGSAVNSSDYFQSALRAIVPVVEKQIQFATGGAVGAATRGAERSAIPSAAGFAAFAPGAEAGAAAIAPLAALTGPFAPLTEGVGAIGGGLLSSMGVGYATGAVQEAALKGAPEFASAVGQSPEQQKADIAQHPEAAFAGELAPNLAFLRPGGVTPKGAAFLGTLGAGQEAAREKASGEPLDPAKIAMSAGMMGVSNKPTELGEWLSPGLKKMIGTKLDKPPNEVTQEDADKVVAEGAKDIHPPAKDFKIAATVTGLPEKSIDIVYHEAGVTPEEVVTEAQRNPAIIPEMEAGKIPGPWQSRVEEKPILPPQEAEGLHVDVDPKSRLISVVDKDGDHVQGGFDDSKDAERWIAEKKHEAEYSKAVEAEAKTPVDIATEKTAAGEQTVIPGAEKISDKSLAERIMGKLLGSEKEQKPANEGLFDIESRKQQDMFQQGARAGIAQEKSGEPAPIEKNFTQKTTNVIPPSERGKPTSLRTFLSNNGAKFNENNELVSISKNGERVKGEDALEYAHEIAKEHNYLPQDEANQPARPITDLQNALTENEGRDHVRSQDIDRQAKYKESDEYKKNIEEEAYKAGIEIGMKEGESIKKYITRLRKEVEDFYKSEAGSGITPRAMIGKTIEAAEKFVGKLTGSFFEKLGDAYIKTFQPELMGPIAKRMDAFLAKNKASIQEAQNAFERQSKAEIRKVDKETLDQQKEWLYDHETSRWNEDDDPDHARMEAMYDAMHKAEQDAGVGTSAYKENYLPHEYEKPDAVAAFFRSDAMIKKYGKDWFNKASVFKLVQEADLAGFKLKTYNREKMLVSRQLASDVLLRTMDLFKDMEGSGAAVRATAFGIDKKIAKTEAAIAVKEAQYKEAFEKKNPPAQTRTEGTPPASSKAMQLLESRLNDLKKDLADFNEQKAANKLTPEQMAALKNGFRVIGPDNKAWNIHQEGAAIWKNAMEMKGLYENQGLGGAIYRPYMGAKAIWVRAKMLASFFHPTHEVVIDVSSSEATVLHHLIQGGKISDLTAADIPGRIGLTKNTFKFLKGEMPQDHPKIVAWNTPKELRTPEQQADVDALNEGGLVPKIPRQDAINFRDNFDKAISGLGKNNLRLLSTALEIPSLPLAPLMEHWIPGMKVDSYFQRRSLALARDPSLLNDAGRRTEIMRGIGQDIERNYGEMNRHTQFWNPIVRDAFNAIEFSGGWKLAMIQNFRGLLEPGKVIYNYTKTGEFSKEQITHQMLQSYIYTANMLMLGAGLNYLFTGAVGTLKDWINPQTGEKNPDGTPIRLRQPAFFNEPIMLLHDINEDGVVAGTGSFFYHQTLIPGIKDSLLGQDFVKRPYITDATDLQQWKNMGLDSISPMSLSNADRAEQKGDKTAERMGWLGFPIAGSYINQTPFEQKVLAAYHAQHGDEGGAYPAKLKAEMKGAIVSKNTEAQKNIENRMKAEGMSQEDIAKSEEKHTGKFSEFAWSKLSAEDQKRLIESASDEEKKKYKVKSQ